MDDALPTGEAFEELVRQGCALAPQYQVDIDAAADRLRGVLCSGDEQRVPDGSQALAEWIDARLGAAIYARFYR